MTIDFFLMQASFLLGLGNPLAALQLVGTRQDPHGKAVRGIALAQLGELERAEAELLNTWKEFSGHDDGIWRAKIMAALGEVAFARRDVKRALTHLDATALRHFGDTASADYVDLQRARLLSLLGKREEAEGILQSVHDSDCSALARAEIFALHGRFSEAFSAAEELRSANPFIEGEARKLGNDLSACEFSFWRDGRESKISLVDFERLSDPFLNSISCTLRGRSLRKSPSAVTLLGFLARGCVTPLTLFGRDSESLRYRLRMEVSRARGTFGINIVSTKEGYRCAELGALFPDYNTLEALLSDGLEWAPSAAAAVLGVSTRTVERDFAKCSRGESFGEGPSRKLRLREGGGRTPTHLLLVATLPRWENGNGTETG